MKSTPVQPGDVLAGKYRVERVLGEGGMGIVVSAFHIELEQLVAVKFLLPEFVSEGEAAVRFRREARAAVKIKNEHVARVLDVGTMDGDIPFMVMEYLDGHDLAEELIRRKKLPVAEAVNYVLQANEAIAEAHSVGIVHRDLKPANLFLANRPGGAQIIKVLDFGISKLVTGSSSPSLALTRTQSMMGSPLYMSPEQLESTRDVDPRTDIWSLGVILHEAISGDPPFFGDTMPQLVRSVLSGKRPSLVDIAGAPAELEAVVRRCLAVDKNRRYDDIGQLSHALVPFGHEQAVVSAARASRVLGTSTDTGGTQESAPQRHSAVERARTEVDTSQRKKSQVTSASYAGVESQVPMRSRSTLLVAAALGAALVAVAILYSTKNDVAADSTPADPAATEPALPAPATPPPVADPDSMQSPVSEPPAPHEPADPSDDESGALAEPPTEPATRKAPPPTASTPPASVPQPPASPTKPPPRPIATPKPAPKPAAPPPAATAPPATTPSNPRALPDFGGRR